MTDEEIRQVTKQVIALEQASRIAPAGIRL
jgi:hypothetical protein